MADQPCVPPQSALYVPGTSCGTVPCGVPTNCSGCYQQYKQDLQIAVEVKNSWNVPGCGQQTIIFLSNFHKLTADAYLWNSAYGYFQIISFDEATNKVVIQNNCSFGDEFVGKYVPSYTSFSLVVAPSIPTTDNVVFLVANFTAPPVGVCVEIEVTSTKYLYPTLNIYIGSAIYVVQSIIDSTRLIVCNAGNGFSSGVEVIAFTPLGQPQYPIIYFGHYTFHNENAVTGVVLDVNNESVFTEVVTSLTNPSSEKLLSFFFKARAAFLGGLDLANSFPVEVGLGVAVVSPLDDSGENVVITPPTLFGLSTPGLGTLTTVYQQTDTVTNCDGEVVMSGFIFLRPQRSFELRIQGSVKIGFGDPTQTLNLAGEGLKVTTSVVSII